MDFMKKAKLEAINWAHDVLEEDFVVLDTETTDKLDNGGEVIQIGIVDKDGTTLMNQLVKPKGKISAGAANVHGITEEAVKDAPTFDQVYPELKEILGDKLVIAYNVGFDKTILEHTCDLYSLPHLENKWSCAMLEYAKYYGDWQPYFQSFRWKRLTDAIKHLKIITDDLDAAHDACADVRMTIDVMKRMAEDYVPAVGG